MKMFDVYPLYDIEPVRGCGNYVYDKDGVEYLDLYGGHAVISIGHSHPHYVEAVQRQVAQLGFYSNSVQNSLQTTLAEKLGRVSGYCDYSLFLCNSGAEANENAIKLASFHTGKSKLLAFKAAFHGRTSGAVAATDNPIEGIQGVAGIHCPTDEFFVSLREVTAKYGVVLIVDEIQSGYGRSGDFFAHQHSKIKADIITVAKGIANGFPMGGVLIAPHIEAKHGMLGTTFGGNHLACAAAIAVLEVIESENLVENAREVGQYLISELQKLPQIVQVRGRGLMIGIEIDGSAAQMRKKLLFEHHIFTGGAGATTVRLLPALTLTKKQADIFITNFKELI